MTKSIELQTLEHIIRVQRSNNTSDYMCGLLNGLIVAHACISKAPMLPLADTPKKKNKVRYHK